VKVNNRTVNVARQPCRDEMICVRGVANFSVELSLPGHPNSIFS
jgi:hypothetical protein